MADATEPTGKHGFFAELSRRHVWRAAVLYAGAAWALSQGIAQLGPLFDAPNWAMRGFVIACIIGFPFWVAFAWFYAWTPEGFKREEEVERSPALSRATSRKLDLGIIGVLIVAVVLLASGYFVHRGVPAVAPGAEAMAKPFNPPADTLVVLPFANESGDPKQRYFSDGITEELTNALGQNTALRVIAWDTASHYRDTSQSATTIGKALDVANVLIGKILREGNEIRVMVELVNARTGYQVWSNHYDDSLANVFAVQDQITTSIAGALKVKFASLGTAPKVNPQAYDLVLKARALIDSAETAAPLEQARALLEKAITLDPDYADAHAQLAMVWGALPAFTTLPRKDALLKVHAELDQVQALDPRNVIALMYRAGFDAQEGKLAQAKAEIEHVLALDPSNSDAHVFYGVLLPHKQALAQYLEAAQLDPRNSTAQYWLAAYYLYSGQYAQTLPPMLALMKLAPQSADTAMGLALVYSLLHRPEAAVKAFDLVQPDTGLTKALVAAGRLTYQSVLDPKLHTQALAAVDALHGRTDLDPTSTSDVLQLYIVLGQNDTALDLITKQCAPNGCNDLSDNPTYLPLRGDPRFEALVKKYDTVSQPPASAASAPSSP